MPTINSGLVATDDPLSNELKVDMREKIADLDPDTSQFTTMLMKLPEERANSFKVEWMNDELMPLASALAASAASDLTNLQVTTGEGAYFKAGHIVRNVLTNEPMRVTGAAASSITVIRAIDGSTALSSASADAKLVIVGSAHQQGGLLATALITQRATNYNYTQIIRNSYRFANTARATQWYGGPLEAKERRKKAIEHKWEIENMLFFGARSYTASGGSLSTPIHSSGGLLQYVTNESDTDTLDEVELQTFFRHGLEFGSKRKVLFCAPLVAQVISSFVEEDFNARTGDSVHGIKVDGVISGVSGQTIPVIVKREWKRYGESAGQFGTYGVLVDLDYVQLAPLRDTALLGNRQAPDADEVAAEYLTELSFKCERPEVHRWLVDVTAAA